MQHLLALREELRARGVSCELLDISGQPTLRVHCHSRAAGVEAPDDTVTAALLCGRWWYCWPEGLPISPVVPVSRAAQAIISALCPDDDA